MNRKMLPAAILVVVIIIAYLKLIYPGITGTVVDAETGKPLEGAVVLVEWTKTKGFGEYHTESYKVVEKVTGTDGKFSIPGVYTPFVDAPHLTIYRKGYVAWNSHEIFPGSKKRLDYEWGDTTFKLEHFKLEYSYENHTSFLSSAIRSSIGNKKLMNNAYRWEALEAVKEMERFQPK